MRFVDRGSVEAPPSLATPSDGVARERAAAKAYYCPQPLPPGAPPLRIRPAYPNFSQYRNYDVGLALAELFHGKCAYCESEVGAPNDAEIEHYRPKGGVSDDDGHNGYWWLASVWENLLLSCTGCNQGRRQHLITATMDEKDYLELVAAAPSNVVGKLNQFPVAGTRVVDPSGDLLAEDPALIDPTALNPERSLSWLTSSHFSVVVGANGGGGEDRRGAATVAICALNRSKLVKARTKLLVQLRVLRTRIFETLDADPGAAGAGTALALVKTMRTFAGNERPYSALASAYVDALAVELTAWLASRSDERARMSGAVAAATGRAARG